MTIEGTSEPTPIHHALDAVSTSLDHVIKTVDDCGGLEQVSDTTRIRFMKELEGLSSCLSLIEDRVIAEPTKPRPEASERTLRVSPRG